ncbi:hypothetical protein DL766_009943 [Monosporascus sp. MC13-8B]|nr:hypothetical protein DL766_009943 [Monosporascus sp. MC13-8B]
MRCYITTTYKLGIEFVQDAAIYYARPTWREPLYHSLAKINADPIRKVKDVSDAMAQILKEMDALLNKRVHEIQAQVGQVQTEVGELSREVHQLKTEVAGLHANHETERLAILNSELSQYHIQPDKSYKTWKNSRTNCMLALHGKDPYRPDILLLAVTGNNADGTQVAMAEFYAQKTDFMPRTVKKISAIICLILQLLEADSTMLRDAEKFRGLRARLTSVDSKSFSGFDPGFSLLVEIMQQFDLVYIIIDRVDRISGDFMREFLKNVMFRCTGTKVRTFLRGIEKSGYGVEDYQLE